jgi:hypothetical protein
MHSVRSVRRAYLLRAVGIWLTMRLAVSVVLAFGGEDPIRLAPPALLALIVLPPVLMGIDIGRRRETILLANLGIARNRIALVALVPSLIGECAILVARSVLA